MLGRWRVGYSEETISKIIERANEDHCGTCVVPPKETLTNEKKKVVASVAKYPPS
jgi:2-C-methyl-D-erythritol 4-phosphate cytidylyltransferase